MIEIEIISSIDYKIYSEQPIGPFWFKKRAFKRWFFLVKTEELTKVRRMLKKGINVNLKDEQGRTAFDYALKNHDLMMMILLLRFGAMIRLSREEKMMELIHEVSDLRFEKREVLLKNLEEKNQNLALFLRNHTHSS
jgi:hypothetical protein